jgi:hypothetical protein
MFMADPSSGPCTSGVSEVKTISRRRSDEPASHVSLGI